MRNRIIRAGWVIALAGTLGALAQEKSPEQVLKEKGLTRLGVHYVLEGDRKSPQMAQALRVAQQQMDSEERKRQDLRGRIRNGNAALQQWAADYRSAASRMQRTSRTDVRTYNSLVTETNSLNHQIKEGEKALAALEKQLEGVPDSRDKYLTLVIDTTSALEATSEAYAKLASDEQVTGALAKLNETRKPPVKLGPAPDFEQTVRFVKRLRDNVSSDVVKVQYINNNPYVTATFNGEHTQQILLDSGASIVLLTSEVAKKLGMTPGPNDVKDEVKVADGRKVPVHYMKIRSVRVGAFEVKDVVCAVLPASMNNTGCLLGNTFLRNFTYRLNSNTSELHLSKMEPQASSEEKPAEAKSPAPSSPAPVRAPEGVAGGPAVPRRGGRGPAAPGKAAHPLVAKLNDAGQWKVDKGEWSVTAEKHFRGEGDSAQHFVTPLPQDFSLSFRMKVTKGMRPRVRFEDSGVHFGNEGYQKTLFMHGGVETTGQAAPYELNEEQEVWIQFKGEAFECRVGGKSVATGKRKKVGPVTLRISGGDSWSAGVTEFWDFDIDAPAGAAGVMPQMKSLFDGKSLAGWDGDSKLWTVADGILSGKLSGKAGSCLYTKESYGDFTLEAEFKLVSGNSGILFRSEPAPAYGIGSGYEADIFLPGAMGKLSLNNDVLARPEAGHQERSFNPGDWNRYTIEAKGSRIRTWINGNLMSDVTHAGPAAGRVGLQLYGETEVEFRNIQVR